MMTDPEITAYLSDNGYPPHIVRGGRAGLIRRWREFVEQVERGYPLGLEDYRNDLDVRAIIRLAGAEDAEVAALDDRLKLLLRASDVRVWESAPGDPWWDFGYPSQAGAELLDGLRDEGLL
jgi:hypothetical protein